MAKEGFKYRNRLNETWCGVGVENPKLKQNVGVVFRSAVALGAANFLFTTGNRYDPKTHADVIQSNKQIPCFNFKDFNDLMVHRPNNCEIVGVEMVDRAIPLEKFRHPKRAIYLFGGEDCGLSKEAIKKCRYIIKMPSPNNVSMNLSSAASAVLWDRHLKLSMVDKNEVRNNLLNKIFNSVIHLMVRP